MLRLPFLLILAKMAVAVDPDPEIHEKYLTLPRQEFIEYFNSRNFSWTIKQYDRTFYFGSIFSDNLSEYHVQRDTLDLVDIPKNFDAREQWPKCETIKEINDQGHCGSCWTFGTANTASDRTCIHKDIHVHLAEQDFECQKFNACMGGNPAKAFKFWKEKGLVSNKCKPYNISKLDEAKCSLECVDRNMSYNQDKHFAKVVYRVRRDSHFIKSELVKYGPIQASFLVYEDFTHYRGGIYEYKYGEILGGHSVRVIGFGVEDDVEYWLVANSWGVGWGEKGTFKFKTFQEGLLFEWFMYSGLPIYPYLQ